MNKNVFFSSVLRIAIISSFCFCIPSVQKKNIYRRRQSNKQYKSYEKKTENEMKKKTKNFQQDVRGGHF